MAKQEKKQNKDDEKLIFGLTEKQRSRIYTGIFILVFAIFFVVNNDWGEQGEGPYPPNYLAKVDPASRTAAPDFNLPSVDGKDLSLSQYTGKVVIIDFWATWCAPCRKSIPDLIELKKQYGDNLEIIGISLDTDTKASVPGFVKTEGINYPVVYGDINIAREFGGIQSIPTSFVLDKNGNIYSSYIDYVNKNVFEDEINKLLKESI